MIDGGATSDVDTIVTSRAPIDRILTMKKMEFDNRKKCYNRWGRVFPRPSVCASHTSPHVLFTIRCRT